MSKSVPILRRHWKTWELPMMPKKRKNLLLPSNRWFVVALLIEPFVVTLIMVSIRLNFLIILLTNIWRALYSLHSDGSAIFSQHSLKSDTNLNPPFECGVGTVSRGHALGFRFVADGSDAKILDVSNHFEIRDKIYNSTFSSKSQYSA